MTYAYRIFDSVSLRLKQLEVTRKPIVNATYLITIRQVKTRGIRSNNVPMITPLPPSGPPEIQELTSKHSGKVGCVPRRQSDQHCLRPKAINRVR